MYCSFMISKIQGLVTDLEAGWKLGMPSDQFIDTAYEGIIEAKDLIKVRSISPPKVLVFNHETLRLA